MVTLCWQVSFGVYDFGKLAPKLLEHVMNLLLLARNNLRHYVPSNPTVYFHIIFVTIP